MKRHIAGKGHLSRSKARLHTKPLTSMFVQKDSDADILVRKAELRFTGFLAEHNLPLAAADHLGGLIRSSFPDSKIAQSYACARTKATCLLNDAIAPDLMMNLVSDMRTSLFSLCVDGSNDNGLQKMNPVTVRIYDVNQHKICCKFLDMCLSTESTADAIFKSVDAALEKHSISWTNCVGFGFDNTSVNVGRHNSVKTKVAEKNKLVYFMGCPCHMAHNAARYACSAFCEKLPMFDIEELLVDVYFWFEYSSKRKNAYADFCTFTDVEYRRVLKFISVRWLGMSSCLERILKQFAALKSYFLSTPDSDRSSKVRLARLVKVFENPVTECYLLFLHSCLPSFVTFNLLLQREDPILPLIYDAMIDLIVIVLSRFLVPEVVSQFKANPTKQFDAIARDPTNQLDDSKIHLGFGIRGRLTKALDEGDITEKQYKELLSAARAFHIEGAMYAIKVLPFDDLILKHAGVVDIVQKSKFSLDSIDFIVERFAPFLNIPDRDLPLLETEFALYQTLKIEDLSKTALDEATTRVCVVDDNETVAYRSDVLWHYIEHEFMVSGSQRSKFHYLSRIARLLLTLPHSNADEERVFSRVNKNKTKFRDSLSLDRTLPSILTFQLNRPSDQPCYKYMPSSEVCKKARTVTWAYNKAHSSEQK